MRTTYFTLISVLCFSLLACGKLDSTKKKIEPILVPTKLNDAQFKQQCATADGIIRGGHCLTHVSKELPPGSPSAKVQIVPKFWVGQFIVASSDTDDGRVDIMYDGVFLTKVPIRYAPNVGSGGELAFYINRTGYQNVHVAVWTCYNDTKTPEDKMYMVICPPSLIP